MTEGSAGWGAEAPMDDKNVSDKLSFRYLPQVSQDLLGGRFPLGRTMRNGSREPWGAAQYGLDDSVGSVLGHGRPYGFGTDRLVKFQTGEAGLGRLPLPNETADLITACKQTADDTRCCLGRVEQDHCWLEPPLRQQGVRLVVRRLLPLLRPTRLRRRRPAKLPYAAQLVSRDQI